MMPSVNMLTKRQDEKDSSSHFEYFCHFCFRNWFVFTKLIMEVSCIVRLKQEYRQIFHKKNRTQSTGRGDKTKAGNLYAKGKNG